MKYALLAFLFVAGVGVLVGQPASRPTLPVLIPDSTIERLEDHGIRAHTNHLILFGPEFVGSAPSGETPASIRGVYNLPSSGGSGTIAIVDAFDYPTAENDLNVFSSQFGLPACTTASGCRYLIRT
jgi:kumamolisin